MSSFDFKRERGEKSDMEGVRNLYPKGEAQKMLEILDMPYSTRKFERDWLGLISDVERITVPVLKADHTKRLELYNDYIQFALNYDRFFHATVEGTISRRQITRLIELKKSSSGFTPAQVANVFSS